MIDPSAVNDENNNYPVQELHSSQAQLIKLGINWRVQWKKGVRIFTQKWTLSETLQILHAVLFTWVKQCSACFFPWSVLPFWDITYAKKTHFSKAILWGPFVERKQKKPFVSLNHGVSIIHESPTTALLAQVAEALNGPDSSLFCPVAGGGRSNFFIPVLFLYTFQNPRYLFIFVSL